MNYTCFLSPINLGGVKWEAKAMLNPVGGFNGV
jgi:hypothetical protein